jgi:hypothetical protein
MIRAMNLYETLKDFFVYKFGNIVLEILSASVGVFFSDVLKYTDVQKYINFNSRLNQGWIQHDLVGGGCSASFGAELCRSCVRARNNVPNVPDHGDR